MSALHKFVVFTPSTTTSYRRDISNTIPDPARQQVLPASAKLVVVDCYDSGKYVVRQLTGWRIGSQTNLRVIFMTNWGTSVAHVQSHQRSIGFGIVQGSDSSPNHSKRNSVNDILYSWPV
ncbi:hypothetical protein M378DRAFT_369302 [Amanita muscaria Koide BX008]|uniref:Uncharacterized protein n=1 Tax=Amanita muscaria (strain Koide BX008) TaxID=946122 RepID=A0A0C2THZ9_AMAMK|nr:hypothetical protein M378DRAFT_369302 [Amanita muscaria Koide BX008]